MPKLREGFKRQKLFVTPSDIKNKCQQDPILSQLYITDIGHYPKATNHFVERGALLPQYILIYCLQGEGWCKINGTHNTLNAGQILLIPANTAHSYGSKEFKFWEIYWVHFRGKRAEELASRLSGNNWGQAINIEVLGENIRLLDHIISDLETGLYENSMEYANMRLWHLLGSFIHHCRMAKVEKKSRCFTLVEESIHFMQENLSTMLTLNQLAEHAKVSSSYFATQFREQTGSTPIEYYINLKIQQACKFLVFTNLKIKEIALKLGYVDQYYFSRLFSKILGQSPSAYRKSAAI